MKKLFTLILLLTSAQLFSQPTLQSNEMAPFGMVFTYKHVGSFAPIDTSVQGANQTWDYSSISTTPDPDYINAIVDPTTTVHASMFPTANWAIQEDANTISFFNLGSSMLERVGGYDAGTYTTYSNTEILYLFPMTMGTISSDVATFSSGASTYNSSYDFQVVGYGTIMVPGHTYSNVLMTRVVFNFIGIQILSFNWYDSDNGMPVFQYVVPSGIIDEAAIYLNSITSGIDENEFASGFLLGNPITTTLRYRFAAQGSGEVTYTLSNSLGQVIVSGSLPDRNENILEIDTRSIENGIYFLSIYGKDARLSKTVKVVKQD